MEEAQRKEKRKKEKGGFGALFWRGVLLMEQLQSFLWSPSPGPGSGARPSIWWRDPLRGSTQLQGHEVAAEEGDDEARLLLWLLLKWLLKDVVTAS